MRRSQTSCRTSMNQDQWQQDGNTEIGRASEQCVWLLGHIEPELDGVAVKHHHGSSTMWGGALVHVDARRKHGAGFHTGILDFSDSVLYRDVTCRTVTTRAGSATDWPSVQTTSHTDVMGFSVSAQTRASLSLTGSTRLDPATVLATVKTAAAGVKGGGASLLTTGLQNLGAQVNVENERDSHLALSVTSGKRLVELCTFSAVAQVLQSRFLTT